MIKVAIKLLWFFAAVYVASVVLRAIAGAQTMNHWNECVAELQLTAKLKSASEQQREHLFGEMQDCLEKKSSFLESLIMKKNRDELLDFVHQHSKKELVN